MIKQHIVLSCDAVGCTSRHVEDIDMYPGKHLYNCPNLPNGWLWSERYIAGRGQSAVTCHYCPEHKVTFDVKVEDEAS